MPKIKDIDEFYKHLDGDEPFDKFEVFREWCDKEGVLQPKLEYPAYFEGGLLGVRCKEDIEHREGFLYVPYKMLISVGKT